MVDDALSMARDALARRHEANYEAMLAKGADRAEPLRLDRALLESVSAGFQGPELDRLLYLGAIVSELLARPAPKAKQGRPGALEWHELELLRTLVEHWQQERDGNAEEALTAVLDAPFFNGTLRQLYGVPEFSEESILRQMRRLARADPDK